MLGDKGKKMRKKVKELEKKSSSDGCSYMSLDKSIKESCLKILNNKVFIL